MNLYLMRHAEAEAIASRHSGRDETRPLTDKGTRQARRMGLLLARMDVKIDCAIVSPLTRAVDTADALLDALDASVDIQALDAFRPDGSPEEQWQAIREAGGRSILVVGHLPSIGQLASMLLGSANDRLVVFHKSTLAALNCEVEGDMPHASLEWIASPGMAKRL